MHLSAHPGMNVTFESVPDPLRPAVSRAWAEFCQRCPGIGGMDAGHEQMFWSTLGRVWAASSFVVEQCSRTPALLEELLSTGRLFDRCSQDAYGECLRARLQGVGAENELMGALRRFRNLEMVRIAWRDIAGWADLDETLEELSALAEVCIQESLQYLFTKACETRGTPVNREGEPQRLLVLGMGKLGAWELNYSSDIDLIFAYEEDGVIAGKRETSYGEFYTRLARALVKALDEMTAEGFVFRVDTRLRPFGDSGPLVMSFDAMEHYYQTHAREWERYAMVKARPVAGDPRSGARLQMLLRPFVYRRYLDYRAFGELRDLKQKIAVELLRKDRQDNIKLGPGGIREIEFIGQAFQLIRGGQEKRLQERRILQVLRILGELSYLPQTIVARLTDAYGFLRRVENRIQQYADKQTHDLPTDDLQRLRLAFSLGFDDWTAFKMRLDEVRAGVHEVFEQVIEAPHTRETQPTPTHWLELDAQRLVSALAEMGYQEPEVLLPRLSDFQHSHAIRRLTPRGVAELNRLMPMLLRAIVGADNAVETLGRILKLLEAIASRNVYFSLLAENPMALSQLVKLGSTSSWIVNYIANSPLLLDELLDPRTLYSPLTRDQLERELKQKLQSVDLDDLEQLMTALRQFKRSNVLRVAAADIMGVIPIMVVSDYLTYLAETVVGEVLVQAWRLTAAKHGPPPGAGPGEIKGFGVIAYGKMGGLELGYGSDLDLVFLYGGVDDTALTIGASPIPCAQFYARVGKRMITILSANMLAGTLYEIDLRLRPSGNSGLLVSSLDAYEAYQLNNAWTWEQQALVRARFVAGDPDVAGRFGEIRRRSLARVREPDVLRAEVREMREKMRANLAIKDPGFFDLKQGHGGIADIEFIVQFGVLSGAHVHERLLQWTDVVRLLESLRDTGFVSPEEAGVLKQAYCLYRERTHRAALLETSAVVPFAEYTELRSRVQAIWRNVMER
jgi:glutamate-ammonia-ligase adenylyltransferase